MIAQDARDELEVHEVYLVTTTDRESIIGEYAGIDDHSRLVFVAGPFAPLHIPEQKIKDWERLS